MRLWHRTPHTLPLQVLTGAVGEAMPQQGAALIYTPYEFEGLTIPQRLRIQRLMGARPCPLRRD